MDACCCRPLSLPTSQVGVCNVTIEIENFDQELGDHYPAWPDENGEDSFPSYPGYYAPQQVSDEQLAVGESRGTLFSLRLGAG